MAVPPLSVDVGALRRRVQYQEAVITTDRLNQQHVSWSTLGTFWARITSYHGRKVSVAEQLKAEVSHVLTLRYNPSVPFKPEGQFVYAGRVFSIAASLNVDERNREVDVYCTEVISPS